MFANDETKGDALLTKALASGLPKISIALLAAPTTLETLGLLVVFANEITVLTIAPDGTAIYFIFQ